jgi:hypothetical protein
MQFEILNFNNQIVITFFIEIVIVIEIVIEIVIDF